MLEKYKSAYQYMYEDQLEGAEEGYLEEFQAEFDPADVDWDNHDDASAKFRRLFKELVEDRLDVQELVDAAGLSKEDLLDIGCYLKCD